MALEKRLGHHTRVGQREAKAQSTNDRGKGCIPQGGRREGRGEPDQSGSEHADQDGGREACPYVARRELGPLDQRRTDSVLRENGGQPDVDRREAGQTVVFGGQQTGQNRGDDQLSESGDQRASILVAEPAENRPNHRRLGGAVSNDGFLCSLRTACSL